MGATRERALNSATSALKGAEKRIEQDTLDIPNDSLPLRSEADRLTQFLDCETLSEPQERWVPLRSVFPASKPGNPAAEQVRATARDLIKQASSSGTEALPPLGANFHLGIEWGGEIFGTTDTRTLAAYAAMGLPFVPVMIARTYRFIDANLSISFPAVTAPTARMRRASMRVSQAVGLKSREAYPFSKSRQEETNETLWRIHDCLRDFLLEGDLVRHDDIKRFTATIKATSLFPWLMDERLSIIGQAFSTAHPNQARHGKVPTVPEGDVRTRARTLPPSISSED